MTRNIMQPDKTEFIKGRRSTNNTCRLITLIDYDYTHNLESVVALLNTLLYPGSECYTTQLAFLLRQMIRLLPGSLCRAALSRVVHSLLHFPLS